MLSSISTLQSLAKYNTNKLVTVFDPTNWNVTNSFSMVRMTWDADSNVSSSVGKILNITVTRSDNALFTTRYQAYVRCGNSTSNILWKSALVSNSYINANLTSTSTVLLNQVTECIITGLSAGVSYNITLTFDTNGSTTISKTFAVQQYSRATNGPTTDLFKFLPWKQSTTSYYKCNVNTSVLPNYFGFPILYADTANKGFWIMRESSALMTTTARTGGAAPDQTSRAIDFIDKVTDRAALFWGMQSTAVAKTTASYNFQANSTYVLSCMVVARNLETIANTIDVYIDPSATTNYTGAILIGNISIPIFTTANWTYTSFTYNTDSTFITGNYYIRLLGTSATDKSIIISNCDLVKTA